MPIRFAKPPPYDLWPTKEPTARGVDGDVEVTLTVDTDGSPPVAVDIQVVFELEMAKSLRAKLKSAITMAEIQLKNQP